MQAQSNYAPVDNDIDLRVLLLALWRQRLMILGITVIAAIFAIIFAFLNKPIYEARAFVIPPTNNDIANFNYGRTKDNQLEPFTIKEVYEVFTRNLLAESLRRDFFNSSYLPLLPKEKRSRSLDALYAEYTKWLRVTVPAKEVPEKFLVIVRDNEPSVAVALAEKYIKNASERAKNELLKNIGSEADVLARNIKQEIILLKEVGQKGREDSIVKLREALRVAEAIGLEKPPIISGNPAVEIAGSLGGQLIYMRGTKALKAEILNLESRDSDDPYIDRLRFLQAKYNFFNELESNIKNVEVFRMDGVIEVPDEPVNAQKAVIILIGTLLGLLVGIVLALLRSYIKNISSWSNKSPPLS